MKIKKLTTVKYRYALDIDLFFKYGIKENNCIR